MQGLLKKLLQNYRSAEWMEISLKKIHLNRHPKAVLNHGQSFFDVSFCFCSCQNEWNTTLAGSTGAKKKFPSFCVCVCGWFAWKMNCVLHFKVAFNWIVAWFSIVCAFVILVNFLLVVYSMNVDDVRLRAYGHFDFQLRQFIALFQNFRIGK